MVRISVEELRQLITQGARPVILDARSALARRQDPWHIHGAIAVDIAAPEAISARCRLTAMWWSTAVDQ